MITDPLFYLLAVTAVILLGLSKGGLLGLGVMSLPLMSLSVPPLKAAAILVPTMIVQDAVTLWSYRHSWSAWNLKIMLPSLAVGIAVGALLAASLTAAHIRLAIGIIAAAFVLRHWLGQRFDQLTLRPGVATGVIFGAIGGFTTMLANAGGPAWQIHLLPQKLDKLSYVGTVAILFAVGNVLKLPAYGALGQLTGENLTVGLALLPAAVISNYAGIWMVRKMPTELFFRIAYILMFLISIELIRSALTEMWHG